MFLKSYEIVVLEKVVKVCNSVVFTCVEDGSFLV